MQVPKLQWEWTFPLVQSSSSIKSAWYQSQRSLGVEIYNNTALPLPNPMALSLEIVNASTNAHLKYGIIKLQ